MRLIAKIGYTEILFPENADLTSLLVALEGAKEVDKSWDEKVYKEKNTEIQLTFVKDVEVTPLPEKDAIYLRDIKKATERASKYLKERDDLETELNELKEKFKPFMDATDESEES